MLRRAVIAGLLVLALPSAAAFAVSAKDKMATCRFGADHPMLKGKARADFIKKCMTDKDDPRGPATADPQNQ